jgi:hypothetical protein
MSNVLPDKAFTGIRWEMVKPNDDLLNQREARALLKISQHELNQIRKRKEIPHHVFKGCYFYLKADCMDWMLKKQPKRFKKI